MKYLVEVIRRARVVNEDLDPSLIDRKIIVEIPHALLQRLHKRKADVGYTNTQDYLMWLITKDCAVL